MMLLYVGKKLIGLQAGCIVDEGKTLVWHAGRGLLIILKVRVSNKN